jgi:deoxyxylulose-5-phosphate synthase
MSLATFEACGREVVTRASLLPSENPNRERVEQAVATLQAEIARLRLLQRRDEQRRTARAETAEATALALRKAAAREAKRHLSVLIDKQFFKEIGMLALKSVDGATYCALQKELTRIWELGGE